MKAVLEGGRVEAFVLPKTINKWPSFYALKQETASSSEVYFKRVADSNGPRFNETVRLLLEGRKVISTGLSGIGKSTEINGLLMVFLRHLGEVDWPKEVWYRVDKFMFKFFLVDGVPTVAQLQDVTLASVEKFSSQFRATTRVEDRPVLLLELKEKEIDPSSYIPTYIPLSNRNVYSATKEIQKAGCQYLLVDPPSSEDMQAMAAFEAAHSSNSVFKGMPVDQVKEVVRKRVSMIGPRIREVFKTGVGELEENCFSEALPDVFKSGVAHTDMRGV